MYEVVLELKSNLLFLTNLLGSGLNHQQSVPQTTAWISLSTPLWYGNEIRIYAFYLRNSISFIFQTVFCIISKKHIADFVTKHKSKSAWQPDIQTLLLFRWVNINRFSQTQNSYMPRLDFIFFVLFLFLWIEAWQLSSHAGIEKTKQFQYSARLGRRVMTYVNTKPICATSFLPKYESFSFFQFCILYTHPSIFQSISFTRFFPVLLFFRRKDVSSLKEKKNKRWLLVGD